MWKFSKELSYFSDVVTSPPGSQLEDLHVTNWPIRGPSSDMSCHHPHLLRVSVSSWFIYWGLELCALASQQSVKVKIKNSFIPITVTTKRPDDSAVSSAPSLQPQTAVTRKMTYIWGTVILLIFCDPVDTFKHTMLQHFMINVTASSTSQIWRQVMLYNEVFCLH